MAEEEQKQEITFVYQNAENKNSIPATGAQGGPTPDGASVVANLYVEHQSIPHSVTRGIEDGKLDLTQPGREIKRGEVTRDVQATLVLTPEHAVQLGEWLQRMGNEANRRRKQNFPSDE